MWSWFLIHLCKMKISPRIFFIFSKFWFFELLSAVKQGLCLSHFISQEPYIIYMSFIVHLCKMMISSGAFFIFSKFWFSRLSGGLKGQNIVQNNKFVCCALSQEPHTTWLFVTSVKWWYLHVLFFFHFFRILIFQVVSGVKGQKMA